MLIQVAVFPLLSETVSVTEFAPRLVQLKTAGEFDNPPIAQLSVLPPFTSFGKTVA